MVQEFELIEGDIDVRTFWARPLGSWVLESNNVVAEGLAVSLDKPLEWAAGSTPSPRPLSHIGQFCDPIFNAQQSNT